MTIRNAAALSLLSQSIMGKDEKNKKWGKKKKAKQLLYDWINKPTLLWVKKRQLRRNMREPVKLGVMGKMYNLSCRQELGGSK